MNLICRSVLGSNRSKCLEFVLLFRSTSDIMVLEGKGRIIRPSRGKLIIYIPSKVHNDSTFPFKPRQDVNIRIKDKKLIIE